MIAASCCFHELVTIELLQVYPISQLLITISLMIGMRGFCFGMLSISPNLLPATIVLEFWAFLVGSWTNPVIPFTCLVTT
jgi:hypothetical protein